MKKLPLLLAAFFALILTVSATAQGIITGSIVGTVQDPSGAVIPDAQVNARNNDTGLVLDGKSNAKGEVSLKNAPVGTYTITISSGSFAPLTVKNIVVTASVNVDFGEQKMSVNNAETVSVETSADLLQTSQAQVATTFDAQAITDLPTGGGLDRLALLIPGVVRTLGDNYSNTNGVGFAANGQRGRSNNFEIDGQTNNDNSVTGPQVFFRNEDALQEIQILTENFGAQYGRNAGTIVNYLTKSGTNQIHGTAFYNYTPSFLSSLTQGQKDPQLNFCAPGQTLIQGSAPTTTNPLGTPCTVVTKPRYVGHEWGGSLGGPILKDKLFGFGSALFRHNTNGASPSISSSSTLTPTPMGISQLAAAFPGNPLVASLQNEGPFAPAQGNPTVVSTQNVVVCASTGTCPTGSPAIQFGQIQRTLLGYNTDEEVLGRLDYQATSRDRFFLRYIYQNAPTILSGGSISGGTFYNSFDVAHSAGGDWTHTFGPRWVNQLRYGFQQTTITFGGGAFPNCTVTNLSGCPSTVSLGGLTDSTNPSMPTTVGSGTLGYGFATNIPQGRIVKTNQVQDNVTVAFGAHAITFGGEFDSQNSPNTFLPYTNGSFTFQNFNSALAGVGTLSLANGNPQIPFKENDYALYLQDDWKVTPSLTLNLGMRWEYFGQNENILHNLTVARQTGPNPIWSTALPLSLTTVPQVPNNYKNFQPRLGFAYNPSFLSGLVVRGGFAINFDPQFYNIFLNVYSSAPVVNTGAITCGTPMTTAPFVGVTINCLPSGGTTNALVNALDAQYNPTGGNPGTKIQTNVGSPFSNPYAENFDLGIQKQISRFAVAEVRYVGNHSLKNFQSLNGNPALNAPYTVNNKQTVAPVASAFPNVYPASSYCTVAGSVGIGHPDCNRTYVTTRTNTAFSIYNSLQASLTTRELKGFSGIVSYTFSRTIDNASEAYSSGSSGGNVIAFAPNPFNTNLAERGVSGQSYPNVASAGLVYKLHIFDEQKGILGRLLGGYQANIDWTFNSGQPYTPYQGSSAPSAVGNTDLTSTAETQARYSFCDYAFNLSIIGADACRPILVNPSGPVGSVGINVGGGVYKDLKTGNVISRTTDKWLFNNQFEALAEGTPYPGVSRNTLRGDTANNVDFSIFKTVRIAERVSMQLRLNAYNVLNRAFYGVEDPLISDAVNRVALASDIRSFGSFENFQANSGGAVSTPTGRGTRNLQIGGKIIF